MGFLEDIRVVDLGLRLELKSDMGLKRFVTTALCGAGLSYSISEYVLKGRKTSESTESQAV